jgi:hypothetical protein
MVTGKVVQIIGSVVDVQFPQDSVPEFCDLLHPNKDTKSVSLEVQQRLGGGVVRTVSLNPTNGISLGDKLENHGNKPFEIDLSMNQLIINDLALDNAPNESKIIKQIAMGAGITVEDARKALRGFKNDMNPAQNKFCYNHFEPAPPIWQSKRKGEGKPKGVGKSKHYGNRT